jgi:hypothetical protein
MLLRLKKGTLLPVKRKPNRHLEWPKRNQAFISGRRWRDLKNAADAQFLYAFPELKTLLSVGRRCEVAEEEEREGSGYQRELWGRGKNRLKSSLQF